MINNISLGFKCIKCSIHKGLMFFICILEIVSAILQLFVGSIINDTVSIFLISSAVVTFIQLFYYTNATNIALSSPLAKKMQTTVITTLYAVFSLIGFIISISIVGRKLIISSYTLETACFMLLVISSIVLIEAVFSSIAYKIFLLGFGLLTISIIVVIKCILDFLTGKITITIPFWGCLIICIMSYILSIVLHYFLTRLFYKKPYDKISLSALYR